VRWLRLRRILIIIFPLLRKRLARDKAATLSSATKVVDLTALPQPRSIRSDIGDKADE
jgi:hypothetical protein